MLTDLKDMNKQFSEFYSEKYTSKSTVTENDFDQFLDLLHFPQLDPAFRENLDLDFPTGKAAGPDGFGLQLFTAFRDDLVPTLLRMTRDTFKSKRYL